MAIHVRTWAASSVALAALGTLGAHAEPATSSAAPPVALFVDLAKTQVPSGVVPGAHKQVDFAGLPVLIATGSTTDVGVAANHRLELASNLSIDSHGSISRVRAGSFVLGTEPGTERGSGQATLRYAHDWFALSLSPGLTAEGPENGLKLGSALDNRVVLSGPFDWDLAAASHWAQRSAAMEEGEGGRDGSTALDLTHRLASGSSLGIGYSYGWSSPESAAVSSQQQVEVSANFAFLADVNCSARYRQSLSEETPAQALALDMDWNLLSQGFGATRFKADVSLQRTDSEADPDTLDGAANLGLAMKF
jgi:hypothetical protein